MIRSYRLLALLALLAAWPAWAAYTDNGDGTVTDTVTGLAWDKCTWGQTGNDCSGGAASQHDWPAALAVAVTANAAHYKGHNDWRLPNFNELESLVKIDAINPAIDTAAFPNTVSNWYWSSTIWAPHRNPALAWIVRFVNGDADVVSQTNDFHVRLVRSGQPFAPFDSLGDVTAAGGTQPIPALGPWGLALLSGLLGWFGVRRRTR